MIRNAKELVAGVEKLTEDRARNFWRVHSREASLHGFICEIARGDAKWLRVEYIDFAIFLGEDEEDLDLNLPELIAELDSGYAAAGLGKCVFRTWIKEIIRNAYPGETIDLAKLTDRISNLLFCYFIPDDAPNGMIDENSGLRLNGKRT